MIRELFERCKFGRFARHSASILLLLLLVGCASLQTNPDKRQSHNKQEDANGLNKPATIAPASKPSNPATGNDQQQPINLWAEFFKRLADPVTWFTGGLLYVTARQLRAMGKQTAEMRKQASLMDGQLEQARIAAEAAKKSAQIAELALVTVERGWLTSKRWAISDLEAGKRPIVEFAIYNDGRTPATITSVRAGTRFGLDRRPEPPNMHSVGTGETFLTSGHSVRRRIRLDAITADGVALWEIGGFAMFVEVTYRVNGIETPRTYRTSVRSTEEGKELVANPEAGYNYAD